MRCSGWPVTSKWLVCLAILLIFSGCAQMKTFFKSDSNSAEVKPAGKSTSKNIVLRTQGPLGTGNTLAYSQMVYRLPEELEGFGQGQPLARTKRTLNWP